jgi:hypothetical protein
MQDPERFEQLRTLSPLEAVRAWLEGDFGIGDEPALIEAIRKDRRVVLKEEALVSIICEAMDRGQDAAQCFERLADN